MRSSISSYLCISTLAPLVAGHGDIPRNAVDSNLSPWNGAVPNPVPAVSAKDNWWWW